MGVRFHVPGTIDFNYLLEISPARRDEGLKSQITPEFGHCLKPQCVHITYSVFVKKKTHFAELRFSDRLHLRFFFGRFIILTGK